MLYLFDIDGTLLLTGGAGSLALDQVFESLYGVSRAMARVNPAGKSDQRILAEVFEAHLDRRPRADELARIFDAYVPLLEQAVVASAGYRLMPAVHETLDFLAGCGAHLALATGNIRNAARAKLDRAGLWERFPVGGFGDDGENRAILVQRAIDRGRSHARRHFPCEQIIVVGDTVHDITAARACGVMVLAVATGYTTRAELEVAGADAVFDTLAELPAWHDAWVVRCQGGPAREPG